MPQRRKLMKRILMISTIILLLVGLMGCANTRDPQPCPMKARTDKGMDCEQIIAEYKANTNAASHKISKNKSNDGQDVLLGILIWPGLADFKNADGIEGNALLDRNLYLKELAETKGCDTITLPSQPSRYK